MAQDWTSRDVRRFSGPEASLGGVEIDTPEGYQIFDSPNLGATTIRKEAGPTTVKVIGYLPRGGQRFYLTEKANEGFWNDTQMITWILIPGSKRAEATSRDKPPRILKKETRDFFKEGPVTAEVWEETVQLAAVTEWNPTYRRSEIDFLMPVKVISFQADGESWEVRCNLFPAFDSDTGRIPGPRPEFYGEPYRALITKPAQREIVLRGTNRAEAMRSVFIANTVWAGGFSEGRLQTLRTGWTAMPPNIEVSRLSPPHFTKDAPMRFRFSATRLNDTPVVLSLTPNRIVGADFTEYGTLADLGGPYPDSESLGWAKFEHRIWNLVVRSDQSIEVVAPLTAERGAAGMLELESFDLGPSYEEDLKALLSFGKEEAPLLPAAEDNVWNDIMNTKVGPVPIRQRGPENSPF